MPLSTGGKREKEDVELRIKSKTAMLIKSDDILVRGYSQSQVYGLIKEMLYSEPSERPPAGAALEDTYFINFPPASARKSYAQILIDGGQFVFTTKIEASLLLQCLRYRLNLRMLVQGSSNSNGLSLYDTLLDLLQEFDASGRAEIFRLLLERRSTIPLFLPNGDHHLSLLRYMCHTVDRNKTISLGEDVTLLRVTVISCRKKESSKTAELLKNIFKLESLHVQDLKSKNSTNQSTTAEIGIGFILRQTKDNKQEPVYLLVLHIVGDFDPLWKFIKDLSDVLIIEDSINQNYEQFHRRPQFSTYKGSPSFPGLDGIETTLVWKVSVDDLELNPYEGNDNDFGFKHLRISAVPCEELYDTIIRNLLNPNKSNQKTKEMLYQMTLPGTLREIDCSVPIAEMKSKISETVDSSFRSKFFLLQKSFNDQGQEEERQAQNRDNESVRQETKIAIQKEIKQRKSLAPEVEKHFLLQFFINLLDLEKTSSDRVLSFRQLEKVLADQSVKDTGPLRPDIEKLSSQLTTISQSKGSSQSLIDGVKQQLQEAKNRYNMAVVSTEHFWRELSHLYTAAPSKYEMYPQLAAQHLMDGLPIELVDGDSNMVNMDWIKAIMKNLQEKLPGDDKKSKRFFVLSVMGVQSSGKSTLLNTMFGIQMRTSVGQCTRGINMQLIPVQGRTEYDYILLLDTEGVRAPEFKDLPGSEKRDNQMATLSILLADATIIVNPGENDEAIKDILPIVLLAYQGSTFAEKKGGRLSSFLFFVYNRIDTQQADKLSSIIQTINTSLCDAFDKVSQLGEIYYEDAADNKTNEDKAKNLFRKFKLDSSNDESDVRILGMTTSDPPYNTPNSAYGEALQQFRQHIHYRVTNWRDSNSLTAEPEWKSRSLSNILEYLNLIWSCIRSSDFTLNFKTVMDRMVYDQLTCSYKKFEKELIQTYYEENEKIEKKILERKQKDEGINESHLGVLSLELENRVKEKSDELDSEMKEALKPTGRSKWEIDFQTQWSAFKTNEKQRWLDRLNTFFNCQLKYDTHVDKCKKELRLFIREMFQNEETKHLSEEVKKSKFDELFRSVLEQAARDYPAVNVKSRVDIVYETSGRIKALQIDMLNSDTTERVHKAKHSMQDLSEPGKKDLWQKFLSFLPKTVYDPNWLQKMTIEISMAAEDCANKVDVYMDPVVEEIIGNTIRITQKKYRCNNKDKEFAHILAKELAILFLERRQKDWESVNSVSAKLSQPSTIQEIEAYYHAVSRGIVATELLVNSLTANLQNILPEAFFKEMIRNVDLRVRTKTWLSDPKALQAHLDLALLKLIDERKIEEMLDKIENSAEFYEQVLTDLISNEISEVEKMCEVFNATFKDVINSAVVVALSVKSGRAKEFIYQLKSQCLNKFRDNYLAINLITDGDGYEGCDIEEEKVFREKCLQLVPLSTLKSNAFCNDEWKKKLNREVLIYMQNFRRDEVTRPRCKAYCFMCGSLCIHPANHDTSTIKHDTHHQPSGLTGWHYDPETCSEQLSETLVERNCSTSAMECSSFKYNGKSIPFKDFSKTFPGWMFPKCIMTRLPLREYIFANFQDQIAAKYKKKKCVTIPEDYYHDLATIRSDLNRDANLNQD